MTVTRQEVERALQRLGLGKGSHVLVHTSYKAIGGVEGGPRTVVDALTGMLGTVMMPAFTSDRTGVWDQRAVFDGNAYPAEAPADWNREPEPFTADTPMNKTMGVINETLRTTYPVSRSEHPVASFIAYGALADELVGHATAMDGVEPIRRLTENVGDVLLLGVTHTTSTAIHLAEKRAGRWLFVRYALTPAGVQAARGGGCGRGFDAIQPHVERFELKTALGNATLRAYDLRSYVETARLLIERDPYALLCDDRDCARCNAHRSRVAAA